MMWYVCLLLFVQQAGAAPAAPQDKPAAGEATGDKKPQPMTVELRGLYENRQPTTSPDDPQQQQAPGLRMRMHLIGPRLHKVVRVGRIILDECVDDSGASLLEPNMFSEEDRRLTRIVRRVEVLGGYLEMRTAVNVATRQAAKLAKLRGSVRVIYAKDATEITINNPLSLRGKTIDDPQLKKIGLEVRMLPLGDPEGVQQNDSFVTLQFVKGEEHVRAVEFYDEWMKQTRSRASSEQTNAGERCAVYQLLSGPLNEDCQLVIYVYPEIEDERVPISFDDVILP
ncbi:MAG: hypothetical protein KKB50_19095 [Planctomycetes bacterium]|nr:hypothetical protein [Planctomycetota bacterium]